MIIIILSQYFQDKNVQILDKHICFHCNTIHHCAEIYLKQFILDTESLMEGFLGVSPREHTGRLHFTY